MDYQLKNNLYPILESSLSKKGSEEEVSSIVGGFINRNSERLSYMGPSENIFFTKSDRDKMYNLANTTEDYVKQVVKSSKDIYSNKAVASYPFNFLIPMMYRYYLINSKNEKVRFNLSTYMALSMYPMIYTKYYKYPPNENIMNYTINNLSGKFSLRKTGSLLNTIADVAYGAFQLHEKALSEGSDKACIDIALSMRTRINSIIRKITSEYMKNHKDGNYLNDEVDNALDKDNFKEASTTTTDISNLSNKVVSNLIVNGPNMNLITVAAKSTHVSVNSLRNCILKIVTDDNIVSMTDLIEDMVTLYVIENKKRIDDVHSNDFLLYSLEMYSRHSTKNPRILDMKSIIYKWTTESFKLNDIVRGSTQQNLFRKAIFTFFAMSTQKNG